MAKTLSISRSFALMALAVTFVFTPSPRPAEAETASVAPLLVPVVIGDGPGMLIPLVLQSAELGDEQRAGAFRMLELETSEIRARLQQIARLDVQLAKAIFGARRPPTQAELAPILKRMAALRQEIVDREVAILLHVRRGLQPEQRDAVTSMNHELLELVSQPGSGSRADDTP